MASEKEPAIDHTLVPGEHSVGGGDQTMILNTYTELEGEEGKPDILKMNALKRQSLFHLSDNQITSVAGAMAGFCAGVAVCPLDVAKTRLQAQGSYLKDMKNLAPQTLERFEQVKYRGLLHSMSLIWKEEGFRGLYRGLVPITLGYFPSWMIYFTCYEHSKRWYGKLIDDDNLSYFMSAITSGAASTTLTNPIWVVKTRMMLQMDNGKTIYDRLPVAVESKGLSLRTRQWYNGTFDAFRKMYRQEGMSAFYRGLLPSYFGLAHVAIQFPLYENLKKWFDIQDYMSPNIKERDFSMFLRFVLASCMSKMFASAITYPHEIIRTRLQMYSNTNLGENQLVGVLKSIKSIYLTEGIRGFYSGFVVNLARTVPASAITMVSFEYFKKVLQKFKE